ncbi:Uncharacterized protein SCF082_LOCUS44515 [Durusdinium trenchii]|uniref:Uncharacterized protein n=1 Tax=Durusdinium trenchii TaxID=1381693 RepID=A0ABP0R362_9DINO
MRLGPWAWLLILSCHDVEASRHVAALEEEESSYVVFLQTHLHGNQKRNVTSANGTSSSINRTATLLMQNQTAETPTKAKTSLLQRTTKAVKVPGFGDYVKAFAALAAETTASVGDALGGSSDDDENQDEAVGTSAAVGATIGVVVGATVGVN